MEIKNFFDINITENEDSSVIDADAFCVKRADENLKQLSKQQNEAFKKYLHDQLLGGTVLMKIPAVISFALSVFSGFAALKLLSEKGFSFADSYGPLILAFGAVCIVTLITAFVALAKSNKNKDSQKAKEIENELDNLSMRIDSAAAALFDIPMDAEKIDVFYNSYTLKNGIYTAENEMQYEYTVCNYSVFSDDSNLYFTDCESKYAVALSSIKELKLIESEVTFDLWGKDEDMDSPRYKEFDIYDKDEDCVAINCYAELYISDEKGEYKIVVPGYEYETLKKFIKEV